MARNFDLSGFSSAAQELFIGGSGDDARLDPDEWKRRRRGRFFRQPDNRDLERLIAPDRDWDRDHD
jgi:hypothetical protein